MARSFLRALALVWGTSLWSLAAAEQIITRHANGQIKERFTVIDNKREGLYESFHEKGQKNRVAQYAKDLMVGKCQDFWPNGKLKLDVTFQNGQLTGTYLEYHESGNIYQQGPTFGCNFGANMATSPKRTGRWTMYFASGKKKSEGDFGNDLMTGPWRDYFESGQVQLEANAKDGQAVGLWTMYHSNGKIRRQGQSAGNYLHNNYLGAPVATGVWTEYHDNGKKFSEGTWVKNNRDGLHTEWRADGTKHYEVMFDNAKTIGSWTRFDEAGLVEFQGQASGNRLHENTLYSPMKSGVWVTFIKGKVTKAGLYEKDVLVRELSYGTDPATGVTKIAYTKPDGTREVVEVDKNGIRTPAVANVTPPGPSDQADLIAMSEDPATGTVRTTRRNRDGTTSEYAGRSSTDADGSTRVVETDKDGNRVTTVYGTDGTMTVTHSRPGENEVKTTTTKDGVVTTVERKATGETKTSRVTSSGMMVHQIRDREGNLLRTVREMPDGWMEKIDANGNTERRLREKDGQTTTITMDRSGNTTTTVRDKNGAVTEQSSHVVAAAEPGRTYFEQVLKGTDWDDLPASLKNRYASSERMAEENRMRQAEREAAAARDEQAKLRAQLANAAITAEGQKKLDAIEAERVAAEAKAKARKARFARQEEIANTYATAKDLQRQYDAAIARGDKQEAKRIMALQDAFSEKAIEILEPTPEEAAEMQRTADLQSRVARDVTSRAYAAANAKIAADSSLQDVKEDVTGVTKYVSIGSQMQQETKRTTRSAARERVLAEAKLAAIDAQMADPKTTNEEKEILRGLRESAQVQVDGAAEMLAANSRLTAAGYVVDGALVLTGGKIVQGGARVASTAVGAVRTTLTGRAAAAAGRTTVTLAADAGGAVSRTSVMTAAERAALQEGRAASDISRLVGTDLAGAGGSTAPRISTNITRAELARLHTPGRNLTQAEILVKAEIYRVQISTRATLRQAITDGAPDSVVRPLQTQLNALTKLLKEAQEAGQRAYRGG
ncbi:MAG: toxin-antitoxin system YwqK family antitoxin [Chthonomonas sp.]|nr:toxin-antitoxin system YwqK family antitoxin [Chthonomonas sp.]